MYVLIIERVSFLEAIFTSMTLFAITFFVLYIPTNILIGHFYHLKKQIGVDQELSLKQSPYVQDIAKVLTIIGEKLGEPKIVDIMKKWLKD